MLGWRSREERALDDELQFHLEQAQASGLSRREAMAQLGGVEAVKEACREERAGAWIESVGRDLRLGTRILWKSPGFTLVAVITLALCIGVFTAMFSVLDQTMLQVPPFPQPDRIVEVVSMLQGGPAFGNPLWAGDYDDFRGGAPTFSVLSAYDHRNFNLGGGGTSSSEHLGGMAVTAGFFRVLAVNAAHGRTFLPADARPGHDRVVVLSDALWQSHFAGVPVLGKRISLNGLAYTVIGIMPPGFSRGTDLDAPLWVPLTIAPAQFEHRRSTALTLFVIGRLRPGATLTEAREQIHSIARREAQLHPEEKGMGATAMTIRAYMMDRHPPWVILLMALGGLILLIGCANVAGLGLGRAAARADEMAIRRALGARRARLVRQVLTEGTLLAALAGACGLLLGWAGITWLDASLGGLGARLDGNVLAAAAAAAVVTALCCGLPPALRLSARPEPASMMSGRRRGRDALVAFEFALTLASLVVIAAMAQVIHREWALPLGFNPHQVLTAEISLTSPAYAAPAAQASFIGRLRTAAAALPGVQSAALVSPPPGDWNETTVAVRGQAPLDWRGKPMPKVFGITSGYIRTLRIPLLAGRGFKTSETAPVAIVSHTVARRLFPDGSSPLGQFIRLDSKGEPWREIVGETGDIATSTGDASDNGEIFEPLAQAPMAVGLLLRSAPGVAPDTLTSGLRHAVAQLDPTLAVYGAQPLRNKIDKSGAGTDLIFLRVLELLGGLALLLSAIGLYGVIAFAAARRRREIGIRMALGASTSQIYRLLLGGGLRLILIGAVAGCGLGWLGLRLLVSKVDGGHWHLLPLLAIPALVLGTIAAGATYLPVRRALRSSPMAALRQE